MQVARGWRIQEPSRLESCVHGVVRLLGISSHISKKGEPCATNNWRVLQGCGLNPHDVSSLSFPQPSPKHTWKQRRTLSLMENNSFQANFLQEKSIAVGGMWGAFASDFDCFTVSHDSFFCAAQNIYRCFNKIIRNGIRNHLQQIKAYLPTGNENANPQVDRTTDMFGLDIFAYNVCTPAPRKQKWSLPTWQEDISENTYSNCSRKHNR